MTYSSDTSTLEGLARSWGWVLFYGILTLILGIMVLVWPGASLATIAILFGLQLLVAGIFNRGDISPWRIRRHEGALRSAWCALDHRRPLGPTESPGSGRRPCHPAWDLLGGLRE